MQAIAWATCAVSSSDRLYGFFSTLGNGLREAGMELVVFGPAGDYRQHTGFRHVAVPSTLNEHGRRLTSFSFDDASLLGRATLAEMIAIDRAWGVNPSDSEAEFLTSRTMAFWKSAFDIMQPSIVLGWGSTYPLARLMVRMAQQRQIPAYVMERGPLDNTLGLSLFGQIALGSVNTSPALINPPPLLGERLEAWTRIETYYRQRSESRYRHANRAASPAEQQFLTTDPAPRVLYMGTYDVGSGCGLNDPALGERFGTWTKSSKQAAQKTAQEVRKLAPRASVWSKPHPSGQFVLQPAGQLRRIRNILPFGKRSPCIRNLPDVDIHALVQGADVCVTIASGTQFLALIYDRPLVTLGNGFLMGRNIAYEVTSADTLQPALAAALQRQGWSERLACGRALITSMMQHDLFGLTEDVPTRLKVADLVVLLGRFASYIGANVAPADLRYEEFCRLQSDSEKPLPIVRPFTGPTRKVSSVA